MVKIGGKTAGMGLIFYIVLLIWTWDITKLPGPYKGIV